MIRFETLFAIRYAIRVLERTCRFWAKVDAALKICALLAGSSAIYAIATQDRAVSIAFGFFFALTQALEFALRPADKAAEARAGRAGYAQLLAAEAVHSDQALQAAYEQLCAQDDIACMESLRRIAYNDVVEERSQDASAAYALTRWQRFMSWMA